jgi:hypothetical protein
METSFRPTGGKFGLRSTLAGLLARGSWHRSAFPFLSHCAEDQWLDGSPLTAHSCGGSSGVERVQRSHRIPVSPSCEGTNVQQR